ncbi:MAG: acyl-CoA/acyl-ACP dehydrogenase [Kordiimonadaceae bacterium]|nr:acyl-CoA/acyl-ACP dehydrogenase [Kordiimonadaceae bacterium]
MSSLDIERAVDRYGDEQIELIKFYRDVALEVDCDPNYIANNFKNSTLIQDKMMADFKRSKKDSLSTLNRTVVSESLAYGDCGALLATPSPSLSGALLDEIGSDDQRAFFREHVTKTSCRTFFGVTEPDRGSDAANMETKMRGHTLKGEKLLVGNVGTAGIGTVLFRTEDKFLDMRAAIVTPKQLSSERVKRESLQMFALRGSNVGYIHFEDLPIDEDMILGHHLRPMQQGVMSMVQVFNRFRPSVSAMALGTAQAIVDHVESTVDKLDFSDRRQLSLLNEEIALARKLNEKAARQVDKNPFASTMASLAKMKCCAAAKRVSSVINSILEANIILFDPWLSKALRDVYAFEWMEGTSNIHRNNLITGIKRNEFPFLNQ